jgi:dGTPase
LQGTFHGALIDQTAASVAYEQAKTTAYRQVFNSERVLELEAAGYRAIHGLMEILVTAALAELPSGLDQHIRKLTGLQVDETKSTYQKLLACTDRVSGMTDRYCVDLFRKLSGHAIG